MSDLIKFNFCVPRYSPDELKYLPLNTVSFGPLIENQFEIAGSDDSSDSGSSSSDDSS